jgi:pimeloyl-ACP methyl ester carboxylesterase
MGATTSLLASALAPERVRSLALFEPVIMPAIASGEAANSPLVQGALKRRRAFASRADVEAGYTGRGAFRAWTPQMLKDYVADGFRDTAEGVELSCAPEWEYSNFVNQAHDARGALKASRCPVRIVRAANNSTCRMDPEEAEALAPGRVRMQTIADTTHFLPMEEPGVVAATLRELIA